MGVAACVPRQDCQVSLSAQLITVQTGGNCADLLDGGAPDHEGEVLVLREADHRAERPVPVNLAQFLDKKEQCTAWFQPCCSQYMSAEATAQLDAADHGPMTKEMLAAQEGEVYELSEDISEELKLMGMEVWLQAALSREDSKCMQTASEARSYSASRQPEEEPGANEEAECKAASSSPWPLDDVVEIADVLEASRPSEPSDALAPSTATAADEDEAVPKETAAAPAADPGGDADAAAEGDFPRLFHISALDLGDDAADEPTGAGTDRTVQLDGLHHVATASSAASASVSCTTSGATSARKGSKVKRRTRAEVMLW